MAEIKDADDIDFARFYGGYAVTSRWIGKGLWSRRVLAAFGCVIEVEPGVWMGFLDIPVHARRPSIYRHAKQVLAQAKEAGATVIKAGCDTSIPRAKELMERLGFVPTDEELEGKTVWICHS